MTKKYNGNRIAFGYLDCPACGIEMSSSTCTTIQNLIANEKNFKARVYDTAYNLAVREKLYDDEDFKKRSEY